MRPKTLTEQIREASSKYDIRSVLGLTNRSKVIVCPLPFHIHKNNTPSFSIFTRGGKQWWRCHGSCDLEGDVVDLVGFMRVPGYDKKNPGKIREALECLDQRYIVSPPKLDEVNLLSGTEYLKFLPPGKEVIEYASSRGLNELTIKEFKIGQSGHYMTIPLFEDGILKGVKMRNILPSDKRLRFMQLPGSRLGLFNYDNVYLKTDVTFIVKGEIPAMLMHQLGFQVCAPTGGEGSGRRQAFRWNTALALSSIVVIGDNDAPGKALAQKRADLFGAMLVFPPERYKDVDEWILDEEHVAVNQIRAWREQAKNLY